ncbi:uncharacterized protein [Macrobrachium rosenbergii]|uniref:uncharacterized protein n=1 Tax=Macrobrachium rosenbergii TaxID=79674 RepID=UPI0034D521FE
MPPSAHFEEEAGVRHSPQSLPSIRAHNVEGTAALGSAGSPHCIEHKWRRHPAAKVCGETLAVPREFFPPSADGTNTLLPRLRELAQKFAPCHKTFTDRTTTYSLPALHSCAYVFVRVDAHRPPLTRPYRAPPSHQAYLLDIHGRENWITIDRLKPAFLLDSKVREEEGRHPRVPPQYLPADTTTSPPKWGLGRPRKHIKPAPDVGSTPCPQFSRSRGPLRLPQNLRD